LNSNRKAAENVLELRKRLLERFPDAHRGAERPPREAIVTGVSCLDEIGIERGTLTEIIGSASAPSAGGGVFISSILQAAVSEQRTVILIDGRDSFDPATNGDELCQQLLWVRCRESNEAIKSADLFLHDGNLPLIIMDLQLNDPKELNRIPGTTWFRLRNLAEQTAAALITLTPAPIISSAHLRLNLKNHQTLTQTKNQFRQELHAGQQLQPTRQRTRLRQSA